jgi:quinol monooxygenase YgiN
MIIIAGHLRVASGERDRFLAAVADVARQAREAPGCHDFVQAADPIEPDRINIYERWESDEDLLRFRGEGGPPAEAPDPVEFDVRKYRISTVEQP